MSTSWSTPPGEASDAELISRTRAGWDDAYAQLFTRHRGIALGVARRVAGPDHADDLVAEAFTKVLAALRSGGGPDDAFRGYLLTTVRNLHLNTLRATRRESLVGDYEDVERHLVIGDGVDDLLDGHAVTRAFAALPERWQTVLWLGTVEGRPNGEIAQILDLTPNAVAALSFRARDGLREAYLADHLLGVDDPGCRPFHDLIPAYVRGNLTRPRQSRVTAHLDGCVRCAGVVAELSLVEANLAAYLAPLLFVPLLGSAAAGTSAGAGVLGWFTKLGGLGKAATLTATLGPVLAATVVAGSAMRGEDPPDPAPPAAVAPLVPAAPSVDHPVRRPVRRPAAIDPAPAVPADLPSPAAAPISSDEIEPSAGPADPAPAGAAAPAVAVPGPGPGAAVDTATPTPAPAPRRFLRRLVDDLWNALEPVVETTTAAVETIADREQPDGS